MPAELNFTAVLAIAALVVVAALALGAGLFLLAGLFQARSLVRRELSAYFLSPIAYVMLVVFLLVIGYRFSLLVEQLTRSGSRGVEHPMQFLFSIIPQAGGRLGSHVIDLFHGLWTGELPAGLKDLLAGLAFWLVYLLIPPLLTMRLFAEERSTGTLEVLMTAPLRDWQVVLSKYAACLTFYVILWLPTLVYLPILLNLHDVQWNVGQTPGEVAGRLFGTPFTSLFFGGLGGVLAGLVLFLLPLGAVGRLVNLLVLAAGGLCASIGLVGHYQGIHVDRWFLHVDLPADADRLFAVSAGIDPMPVVSSYLGLLLAGAMFLALGMLVSSLVKSQMVAALLTVVLSLGLVVVGLWQPQHISQDFGRGIVDTRYLVFYGSVALFCLFLTVRSLEMRRWR